MGGEPVVEEDHEPELKLNPGVGSGGENSADRGVASVAEIGEVANVLLRALSTPGVGGGGSLPREAAYMTRTSARSLTASAACSAAAAPRLPRRRWASSRVWEASVDTSDSRSSQLTSSQRE
jgi:hypothetical protein